MRKIRQLSADGAPVADSVSVGGSVTCGAGANVSARTFCVPLAAVLVEVVVEGSVDTVFVEVEPVVFVPDVFVPDVLVEREVEVEVEVEVEREVEVEVEVSSVSSVSSVSVSSVEVVFVEVEVDVSSVVFVPVVLVEVEDSSFELEVEVVLDSDATTQKTEWLTTGALCPRLSGATRTVSLDTPFGVYL